MLDDRLTFWLSRLLKLSYLPGLSYLPQLAAALHLSAHCPRRKPFGGPHLAITLTYSQWDTDLFQLIPHRHPTSPAPHVPVHTSPHLRLPCPAESRCRESRPRRSAALCWTGEAVSPASREPLSGELPSEVSGSVLDG